MPRSPVAIAVVVAACVFAGGLASRLARAHTGAAPGSVRITPEIRRAGLRFSPTVAPTDRQWILAAIAKAQPQARELIDEVDGLVTVDTAGEGPMMGYTRPQADGYTVWLNLRRLNGTREIDRATTVLHELGHVVDFALIGEATARALDDGIPRGGYCQEHNGVLYGNCAAAEERLADTFAKWALGGAVSAVGAGYGIASPPSLVDWGRPLGALAAQLPAA